MLKKYFTFIVTVLIVNLALSASVPANGKEVKELIFAEKVKASINKLGIGKESEISVRLKDGTKLKGYISEITDDHFSVTNPQTGLTTAVDYHKAKQVKGQNLSKGAKIAIGVGIAVAFVLIIAFIGNSMD